MIEPPKIPKGSIVLAGYLDVTVAYISGQIPAKLLPTDLLIPAGTSAGLKELSVLSIDKIVMLVKEKVEGILGEANDDLKLEVNALIASCLMFHDIECTTP